MTTLRFDRSNYRLQTIRATPAYYQPAAIILSLIRIALLSVNSSIILYILEGVVHQPPIAPHVSITLATVDQVLLTQWDQFVAPGKVLSFQRSSGWEWPTWATLSLVFHCGHISLFNPINFGRCSLKNNTLWNKIWNKYLVKNFSKRPRYVQKCNIFGKKFSYLETSCQNCQKS